MRPPPWVAHTSFKRLTGLRGSGRGRDSASHGSGDGLSIRPVQVKYHLRCPLPIVPWESSIRELPPMTYVPFQMIPISPFGA